MLKVDDVRTVAATDIDDEDARAAGAESLTALLARLDHALATRVPDRSDAGGPGTIWRIQFHHVGADDRIARRNDATLDEARRGDIQRRLDRMDRASSEGAWTASTLQLIARYPGVVSTALARHMGFERQPFKTNVRKLKELGLTESLEVGYRLSPLGTAFVGGVVPAAEATGDRVSATGVVD